MKTWGRKVERNEKLVEQLKAAWENEHGEEITVAYNDIIAILAELDMYSANMLVNLLWLQTTQKTYVSTVGKSEMKKEKGGEIDG